MNKLTAIIVGCLFLQLTSGESFPFSRRETTRDELDNLVRKSEPQASNLPEQMSVPVVIRYSTTKVVNLAQDEEKRFIGVMCGQSVGKAVNVTMLLNNNPGWDPIVGIVNYKVVDASLQGCVLCQNVDRRGNAVSGCFIESWPNHHDMIIIATAGPACAIALSVNAEFYDQGTSSALNVQRMIPDFALPKSVSLKPFGHLSLPVLPILLTQSVSVLSPVSLGYLQEALIQFSWCSKFYPFSVDSTVTSSDGESSYTQYICDKLPCDVGLNNIAHNGEQLAGNTIRTDPMRSEDLYVVVVNWGGSYDEATDTYFGNFLYNANRVSRS